MATIRQAFFDRTQDGQGRANPGPIDREWVFNHALAVPQHWKSCVTRTVNVQPFVSPMDPAAAAAPIEQLSYKAYWAYYILASQNARLSGVQAAADKNAIVLAELMGANLSREYSLDEASARDRLRLVLLNRIGEVRVNDVLIPRAEDWSILTAEAYLRLNNTDVFTGRNLTRHGLPDVMPATQQQIEALNNNQRGQFMFLLAAHPVDPGTPMFIENQLRNHLVSILVGVVKKGCVSQEFVGKIRAGMLQDFGTLVTLDANTLSRWYQRYGSGVDDTNIPTIIRRWLSLLPEEGLRLILTLSQASGKGMTHYTTIVKAMKKFPTFNWYDISAMYPADMNQFALAVVAVDQNAWYGYKRDLGAAKASGFRNLGWVSKELLVRGTGDRGLNNYAGWANGIPQQARVVWMICSYLREPYNRVPLEEWGDYERPLVSEVPAGIAAVINAAGNIYD